MCNIRSVLRLMSDGPCEAEFVSIRIKDAEIPLTPGSVSRREFGPQTSRHGLRQKRIQVAKHRRLHGWPHRCCLGTYMSLR